MTEFSYQLYSSRNFPPLADTLRMLKKLGYAQVEGYGGVYGDLPALKAALDETGLAMTSGHFGIDVLENEPEKVIEIAKTVGMQAVYCPFLVAEQRPTDAAGYARFGERLQKAGEPLTRAGLVFGWHNHDFEFRRLSDGAIPQAEIFHGGPELSWEADIAWIARGGADPIEWIGEYAGRVSAIHVKDIAPEGEAADEDGWADVGTGTMDWKTIFDTVREKTKARFFVMEHDKPNDHERFARRSIENARNF
ncbi:sugar phosphate isomerase/epimerase [Chelativorans sp. AA-79]|uniref:sugar phosphate isomerase/epimerase family protein n=1 Tax=Chelativorans sp. AA-79 TaxID=3028735 RepID=UPI0023F7BEC7|nr:sugar phosphate isomerase/epimerase [Chelativorans sp. AA-79]WEX08407.1 sugar phosphate isomerase/epimerase [Chelativorans sp. AA-79]